MSKLLTAFTAVILVFSLNACVSSSRLYYFHDKQPGRDSLDTIAQISAQKIQKNDRLSITISSTDPALTSYLNPFNLNAGNSAQINTGYLVSREGNIEFPLLGQVMVGGLSTVEASRLIREQLSFYYKDLFVNVNIRGQVYFISGRGGTPIPIVNERLTIFEAISQAGAQDPLDIKNSVWLIREKNGERIYAKLDLNSKDIFQSPYFYLHNNDLIYLKPSRFSSFLSPASPGRNALSILAALLGVVFAIRNFR